jgi:hypothetical protein
MGKRKKIESYALNRPWRSKGFLRRRARTTSGITDSGEVVSQADSWCSFLSGAEWTPGP